MSSRSIVFEWDKEKDQQNKQKHRITFALARRVFEDPHRVIISDKKHSQKEERYYCIGKIGVRIVTVRFTHTGVNIRIFGAGYWRGGKKIYEKENNLHTK